MEKGSYQFEDFLVGVDDQYKDFVLEVNELLLQAGCKVKIGSSKINLFSVKYTQGRRGVFNFMLRRKSFKASVYAANYVQYLEVLNRLPESMVAQISKVAACKNMDNPPTCWDGCIGYDIPIGEENYQKCRFKCFQFDVNAESIPFLLELLESELKVRAAEQK
ncbi:MAG: hypothetical protein FWE26_02650 [Coriobacteriia bacterium]|nr:hypothetical protein [Coriobacteriia bacterium]MCL2870516.1 hypothetical protein [Coriobacteriia bacterium]